jgi:hypothetical protein
MCLPHTGKNCIFARMEPRVYRLLQNLNVLPELGRQRCFELGNPFYFKDSADENEPGNENDEYYRKELPTGELYLVKMHVKTGPGKSYQIEDTVIRRIR